VFASVTAGLFPGQGSHTSDLRDRVERIVPELLERSIELVGEDPFERVSESTRFAQPAVYCASIAGWTQRPASLRPVALAGHSLGELSALVAAQALDPVAGLKLAVARGEAMAAVARGAGGMLAVLGADAQLLDGLAEEYLLVLANDNAPGQIVLAGPLERLRAASIHVRAQGARTILLDVAGAFHSPAMAGAVAPFRDELERIDFQAPAIPVISSSTASPFTEDVRSQLAGAIVRPVRWRETMLALARLGASTFVDFGPGTVLARLVRRNLPDATVLDLDAPFPPPSPKPEPSRVL
jgi:[acyl-carrier-protein] S-malonyltransferase